MDILISFFGLNFHIVMTQKKPMCTLHFKGFFWGNFFLKLAIFGRKKNVVRSKHGFL
jgi:hypothetical protein